MTNALVDALAVNPPPFSSIQIQWIEGGFVCAIPPSLPVGAEDANAAASVVSLWLESRPSAPCVRGDVSASFPEERALRFDLPEPRLPLGSTFQCSKILRMGNGVIATKPAFLCNWHTASQGSGRQVVLFRRADVLERFREWLTLSPLEAPDTQVVNLAGIRANPEMETGGEDVFVVRIRHSSLAPQLGNGVYLCTSDAPKFATGLIDADVVTHIVGELDSELEGIFAARFHESFLEIGPRVAQCDDSEEDGE